jgi:hypothetical protein
MMPTRHSDMIPTTHSGVRPTRGDMT